uniref:Uncharacterized protein n=1 Tax=Mycobacterium sp. (strain JLS) TaxID=164757 RepID=A0A5Q5CMI8_MYCSJ
MTGARWAMNRSATWSSAPAAGGAQTPGMEPSVGIELVITHNVVDDGGAGHGQDSSIRFLVGRTRCLPTGCESSGDLEDR